MFHGVHLCSCFYSPIVVATIFQPLQWARNMLDVHRRNVNTQTKILFPLILLYTLAWSTGHAAELLARIFSMKPVVSFPASILCWLVVVALGVYGRRRIRTTIQEAERTLAKSAMNQAPFHFKGGVISPLPSNGHTAHLCGDCLVHALCSCCAVIQEADALHQSSARLAARPPPIASPATLIPPPPPPLPTTYSV
jgi:hypothetical protein